MTNPLMQQIGRFQITRELGRGGMGIVYEALDPVIGRTVAVKTIRIDTAAETAFLLDRLFREARSAGALAHPGIVIIFDVGRDGDLAYIAMERVDGPTLESLLESQPMPPHAMTLDILRQTADALDHAHESGIVHRDIKPANIMLHKGKTVKVTDFGIAKIQNTQHKSTGIMGTPTYMSPEHITGKPVDGRSDQFALAVMAFKMLTGTMPFRGDDIGSLVYQIVHEERPSAANANPALPSGVNRVFRRALAKDPKDRYSTCSEFIAALVAEIVEQVSRPVFPQPLTTPAVSPTPPPRLVSIVEPPAVPRRSKAPLWYTAGALGVFLLSWLGYTALNSNRERPRVPDNPQPQSSANQKLGDTKVNSKDNLTYVWIAPGDFTMGCSSGDNECYDDEKPPHHVTLTKGFWIGQTEVTQEAYQRVIGSNPSNFRGGKLPVEQVNWNESKAYCQAVNMRLPTEAEWEYAALGGNPSARYGPLANIAWFVGNSGNTTHEVGLKQKNSYGLFDMLGNIWEWTADFYDEKYYASSPGSDPTGPPSSPSHTLRGGSWDLNPGNVRASYRSGVEPEGRYNNIGFRCAGDSL